MTIGKLIVHQLCDGAVEPLHEWAEVGSDLEVTERVIVIAQQARDPRDESVLLSPMMEAIPEDPTTLGIEKNMTRVTGFGSDEVDGVVAIPVFEAVIPSEDVSLGCAAFSEL